MLGSTRARNLRTHTQKNASSSSSSPPALALPVASLALTPATIVFSPLLLRATAIALKSSVLSLAFEGYARALVLVFFGCGWGAGAGRRCVLCVSERAVLARARAERAGGRLLGGKAKALGAGSEEQGEQSS